MSCLLRLLALLIVLIPSTTLAAPTFVKSESFACTDTPCYPATQFTFTYTGAGAGNFLVLSVRDGSSGSLNVTSSGMTWNQDIRRTVVIGTWDLEVWSSPNVSAGNHSITITKTGSAHSFRVVVLEFSGMGTAPSAHQKASATGGLSSQTNAGSVTTTVNGCLLFAVAAADPANVTWVAGNGFTLRSPCVYSGEPDQKLCTETRGPVNAGTYSNGFSTNINGWAAALVAYAPSGGDPQLPPAPSNLSVH